MGIGSLIRVLRNRFAAALVCGICLTLASPPPAMSSCGRDHGRTRERHRSGPGVGIGISIDLTHLICWLLGLPCGEEEEEEEEEENGDDPDDTPPPVIYGEELEPPLGILLIRDDPKWIPEHINTTTVTAKIYHKPADASYWVPSNAQAVITVRFKERSNEKGMALNKDLPDDPQDSPDIYLPADLNGAHSTCEDAKGKPHLMNTCTTKAAVSQQTFVVASEDYGSFSTMEASCEGCVKLKPPPDWGEKPGFPPRAYEAEEGEDLVAVPKDDNINQIADEWIDEKLYWPLGPKFDTDVWPKGRGKGDGITAYEEYRGFFVKGEHQRTSTNRKDLFVVNNDNLPTGLFVAASKLEVHEIERDEMDENRVINFNRGHAKDIQQHGVIMQSASLKRGISGDSKIGPPKNVDLVRVDPSKGDVEKTVAHELGHAVTMVHHGPRYLHPKFVTQDPRVKKPKFAHEPSGENFGQISNTETGETYDITLKVPSSTTHICGYPVSKEFIPFGEKGDELSGREDCIMRYNYVLAYKEPRGRGRAISCTERVRQARFCESDHGISFNKDGWAAGRASSGGNCRRQMKVRDD